MVNAITRQNPNRNTSDTIIRKRFRGPNKKNKMDNPNQHSIGTQMDKEGDSNIGKGRKPIDKDKQGQLFQFNENPTREYCHNLQQVLGEAFLAEATVKDKNLQKILRIVEKQDWDEFKRVSMYYYNLRRDLAISPSRCLLYDGKLVIPYQLQNTVINAVHLNPPGTSRHDQTSQPNLVPPHPTNHKTPGGELQTVHRPR